MLKGENLKMDLTRFYNCAFNYYYAILGIGNIFNKRYVLKKAVKIY